MKRNEYSAGAVSYTFWFLEFRKVVQLLAEGKTYDEIKKLSEEENIFGAPSKARAKNIYSATTARIKALGLIGFRRLKNERFSKSRLFEHNQ